MNLLSLLLAAAALAADPSPVSFRDQIAPILVKNCLGCHNAKKAANKLEMTTFALLQKGGKDSGADILLPGDPEASELIASLRPDASPRMPYKLPPLSEAQIQTLDRWVKQGAKFDGPSESKTPIASLVDPLRDLPTVKLQVAVPEPITSLAFSPDGASLAAAVGRKVVIYDPSTGKPKATLADHPGPLNVVRYTPDGARLLAAGGRAGMFGAITVWDTKTAKKLHESREGHSDAILSLDVSPDGKTLASAGYDRLVILRTLDALSPSHRLKDHTDAVYAVAFSPDGKTLASAAADRTVKLWNPSTGKRLKTFSDATAELYALAFAADSASVLAAGVDRSIRAYHVADSDSPLFNSTIAHNGPILRLLVSPDGKTLASSGEDGEVNRWALPSLSPLPPLPTQSDWPQALAFSPDGKVLAIGRHDGEVRFHNLASAALLFQPPPELYRDATLDSLTPRAVPLGAKTRLSLTGAGIAAVSRVLISEPGISASIPSSKQSAPNQHDIDVDTGPTARPGLHRLSVLTPTGATASQPFVVEPYPPAPETEPNDDHATPKPTPLPAILHGQIDKPGDVDHFRFHAKQGDQLVFVTYARSLTSVLTPTLALLDANGRTLIESSIEEGVVDPTLTFTIPADGQYSLRVSDSLYTGSANHFYRIHAGPQPFLTSVFPLGARPGQTNLVAIAGLNLKGLDSTPIPLSELASPGSLIDVSTLLPHNVRPVNQRFVVVAEGPQSIESDSNQKPAQALALAVPGAISARIDREGDVDSFRFPARKGKRIILEVFGRRLGSPLDPVIEIRDLQLHPVPRAIAKPIAETLVAFRDHNASGPGIRLTKWNNLALNDTVLIGRELTRIAALPRNPDDDCLFLSENGQRLGLLETTPEHHPMSQPVYKVELHPPGAILPPGGAPPVTLDYRNDDAFGKDSRLTFDPPADGDYLVRVADVRGQGGEAFTYHLVARFPHPDFHLSIKPENPTIPLGGTALLTVAVNRIDGFDAPIDVDALDLPTGITATPARIEQGANSAILALSAAPNASLQSDDQGPPPWHISARSLASSNQPEILHDLDPGGPSAGWIILTPGANLKIIPSTTRLAIRPGQELTMNLAVERRPPFAGRVPIEPRNLPQGVRVLNIGLNGVLITEQQTERTITLYADPWVRPMKRPFYATAKAESAATETSSPPITLIVEPLP